MGASARLANLKVRGAVGPFNIFFYLLSLLPSLMNRWMYEANVGRTEKESGWIHDHWWGMR
jgi:hypothetical protein